MAFIRRARSVRSQIVLYAVPLMNSMRLHPAELKSATAVTYHGWLLGVFGIGSVSRFIVLLAQRVVAGEPSFTRASFF